MVRRVDGMAVWRGQRLAQRRLSPEARLRQNDALTRLMREAENSRTKRARA